MGNTALISVDLDDSWAYLRAHGDPHWAHAPSVLPVATQRLLDLLDDLDTKVTVFVVGRDSLSSEGSEAIQRWWRHGHEVANHSHEHHFDLANRSPSRINSDIQRSEEAIAEITGAPPVGFRCPSFGVSRTLHEVLDSRGYKYEASLLPTVLGPVLRWYHRRSMENTPESESRSDEIFGPWTDCRLPLAPFRWQHDGFTLLEVPVTTVPLVRLPVHMSYLHALAAVSPHLARGYLKASLQLSRLFSHPVSHLIHPPDVLDEGDAPELAYLPGMRTPWQAKLELVASTLRSILKGHRGQRHIDHVNSLENPTTVPWTQARRFNEPPVVTK